MASQLKLKVCRMCLSREELSSLYDVDEEHPKFFKMIAGIDITGEKDKLDAMGCGKCIIKLGEFVLFWKKVSLIDSGYVQQFRDQLPRDPAPDILDHPDSQLVDQKSAITSNNSTTIPSEEKVDVLREAAPIFEEEEIKDSSMHDDSVSEKSSKNSEEAAEPMVEISNTTDSRPVPSEKNQDSLVGVSEFEKNEEVPENSMQADSNFSKALLMDSKEIFSNVEANAVSNQLPNFVSSRSKFQHKKHMKNIKQRFVCDFCNRSFSNKTLLSTHISNEHLTQRNQSFKQVFHKDGRQRGFKCPKCDKIFNKSRVREHFESVHEKRRHQCPKCPKKYSFAYDLRNHLKNIHEQNGLACHMCPKVFESKPTLRFHVASVHEKKLEKKFVCDLCLKKFFKKCHLRIHIESVHGGRRHQCSKCTKSFSKDSNLRTHMKIVHEQDGLACQQCSKIYTTTTGLKRHIDAVHETRRKYGRPHYDDLIQPKKFACNICGKNFRLKSQLKLHIESVHEKKRHQCQKCMRNFSYSSYLKDHMKNVHEFNGFVCQQCPKVFETKQALGLHVAVIHEDNLNFMCDVCGKRFLKKCLVKSHIEAVHEKKRHQCTSCVKNFSDFSYLKAHFKNVHEQNGVACHQCPKVFESKSGLKRHTEAVHKWK